MRKAVLIALPFVALGMLFLLKMLFRYVKNMPVFVYLT